MIWVLGIPRSGTSMLMRMLDAGGCPAVHDGTTALYNPGGLFELAQLRADPVAPLRALPGVCCVKVWPAVVPDVLAAGVHPAAVLAVDRPLTEVAESWHAAFPTIRADIPGRARTLDTARQLLRDLDIPVLRVSFHDLIDKPFREAGRIARFLAPWAVLDEAAMAAVPDPAQRHHGPT